MSTDLPDPETVLFKGEYRRGLDERYRLSIPPELLGEETDNRWVLVKERPGALSLWRRDPWQRQYDAGMRWVRERFSSGKLTDQDARLQKLGRLLSTRHSDVQLMGRGRLLVPEGFREFLGVAAGDPLMIIGAAVCIEIWHPTAWLDYLREEMPGFGSLFQQLGS